MTWLFDVSVLVAIADSRHIFPAAIHRWLERGRLETGRLAERRGDIQPQAWASCPLTENGMIRILSQSSYAVGARTPAAAIQTLPLMKQSGTMAHVFWPAYISVTDQDGPFGSAVLGERIAGTKQITDVYLAALALRNGGRLVTFDSRVAWQAIRGATGNLIEIPGLE